MKSFKRLLSELGACKDARQWAGDVPIEEVVAKCHRGDWLLWLASQVGVELQPLILTKAHCGNTVRHLVKDERSLKALDVAVAFGEGKATVGELNTANIAAQLASDDADASDYAAAYAVYLATVVAYIRADAAAYAAAAAAYAAAAADADADAAYADYAAYADADAAYADYAAYAAAKKENQFKTADICRKYIGQLIIDKVNNILD